MPCFTHGCTIDGGGFVKVVVTGGAGFIGANVCRALAEAGDTEVIAYDNLSTGCSANLDSVPSVALVEADILDDAALDKALAGADSVVHLAARPSVPRSLADPLASHEANATGTLKVLEAARHGGVGQVIVASSSSVYGANPLLPKREAMKPSPVSPYAVSKLAAESYALAWQHSYGLSTLAFRFFNVFGPLQAAGHAYAAVVPAFVDAALAGRPLPVHGDGTQTRDFTYVGSVVAVLRDAIDRRVSHPEPVNLAFGTRTSLLDLIGRLEAMLGHPLERRHEAVRSGDVRDSQADNAVLRSIFPDVRPVPLDEGVASTIDWFRSVRAG
jgi:UDP-glucose 4-epimerase